MSGENQEPIYTSDSRGDDEAGDGSEEKPYKTILQAMRKAGSEPFPIIYVDGKEKEGIKKIQKLWVRENYKHADKSKKDEEDMEKRVKNLEEAKKVVITENKSLPAAKKIRIVEGEKYRNTRVKLYGWAHRIRRQGKNLMFITLRDGTGFLQCVLNDNLCQTYNGVILQTESSIVLYGTITVLPEGKSAPGGHELVVDYWELIGLAPPGGADSILNEQALPDVQAENRHIMIRGENTSKVLRIRSVLLQAFRDHYLDRGYCEITPPSIVQTQLYLETCLPSMGDVFCIAESFRAEQSRTRRHLAEYTHVEAECPFITFEDLLNRLEDLICDVVERVLKSPYGHIVHELNPNFQDIPEMPERKMTDQINKPIMLCRFPANIKSFYMSKCPEDARLTESVDVLLPNVGEIVGGSMRIWQLDELLEGYKREGIDPAPYFWYNDQRKYGTCPHGGYGLGLERFVMLAAEQVSY
ncbi:hypothetical protein NQ317_006704 [Molorchus minor]|uniref:Aminoacyl-transfer RNA synthetases class-II family profile domain-containing protein n=1 Tax=Molorchus minor TaxID=1323400 RepID=A0ABQ9K325_9CUCU|nr:hypothetical protein NQ317_006704 [Molorchus minor]